jgi:hypothetical protein
VGIPVLNRTSDVAVDDREPLIGANLRHQSVELALPRAVVIPIGISFEPSLPNPVLDDCICQGETTRREKIKAAISQ